jgi:hypothetical protein
MVVFDAETAVLLPKLAVDWATEMFVVLVP